MKTQNSSMAEHDFSKGKMWRIIVAQAVPLTIAQLVQLLYNIVDRVYIGHLPGVGSLALTGVGLTFPITTLILAFANLFGTGGAPLFSIQRGAGNVERAREIMGNVFTMILVTSVILMGFCYAFRVPILYLFGASDATIIYADSYLKVYLLGVVFSMIVTGMNGFISALGFPRTAMWTTVIGAVLNLILDPIFIFGLSMGVQGAAAATVISQCVSAIWVLHFLVTGQSRIKSAHSFRKKEHTEGPIPAASNSEGTKQTDTLASKWKKTGEDNPSVVLNRKEGGKTELNPKDSSVSEDVSNICLGLSYMRVNGQIARNVLSLGVSGFMQQATNCVVQIVCNVTLQNYGGDLYVGIMTIVNSIREIASLPVLGISSGAQPVLGYNYGAKKPERVKQGIRFMALLGVAYTAVMWLVIELFPGAFIRIFSSDAETIAFGIRAVRIYFFGFVFMSLQFMGQSTFVGLGKAKRAVFFSILRKIIIVVPLTLLLPMFMGLGTDGVFAAEPISNLVGGLACFLTMYFTLYRKL